jgi:hypothetical protein
MMTWTKIEKVWFAAISSRMRGVTTPFRESMMDLPLVIKAFRISSTAAVGNFNLSTAQAQVDRGDGIAGAQIVNPLQAQNQV